MLNDDNICLNCFRALTQGEEICPYCGYNNAESMELAPVMNTEAGAIPISRAPQPGNRKIKRTALIAGLLCLLGLSLAIVLLFLRPQAKPESKPVADANITDQTEQPSNSGTQKQQAEEANETSETPLPDASAPNPSLETGSEPPQAPPSPDDGETSGPA